MNAPGSIALRQHEELLNAYLRKQREYEDQGLIPREEPTLISRYQTIWELVGALHLGLVIALGSILLNFIFLNVLLHLPPP